MAGYVNPFFHAYPSVKYVLIYTLRPEGNMSTDSILSQAANAIKTGDKATARTLIRSYLKTNPKSAPGWYLSAFVLESKDKQIDALQRALVIAPDYDLARAALAKLRPIDEPDIPPSLIPSTTTPQNIPATSQYQTLHTYRNAHTQTGVRSQNVKTRKNTTRILTIGIVTLVAVIVISVFSSVIRNSNCSAERDSILASNWNTHGALPSPPENAQIMNWLNTCLTYTAYQNPGSFLYAVAIQKYGNSFGEQAREAAGFVNELLGTSSSGQAPINAEEFVEKLIQLSQTGIGIGNPSINVGPVN